MNLRRKGLSLRWKLVLGSVLIEVVMLAVLVINNVRLIDQSLLQQVELRLRELSVLLNASIAPSMAVLDYGAIQGVFAQSRRKGDIVYFVLFDSSGKRVAGDGWAAGVPLPKAQQHPDTGGDAEHFDTEIPIAIGGQSYGRLQFGISTEFLQLARERLVRQSLTIAAIEIALSMVLLAMLGIWLTRHLSKLEAASVAVGQGDFDVTVEVSGADEIGRVAQAFNRMTLEIKRKLTELSASETRFRALIEHAPDAIIVSDFNAQRIVDANLQAEKLFGRSREELLSGGIERFYAPIQPDGLAAAESVRQTQRRATSGESVSIERSIRRPSGEELILEVRVDDMSAGGRRLVRGSFIDISARKRAEASLQLAASVFAHAQEGIVIADAAGNIVEVNDAFTRITGYDRDEACGRNPRFLSSGRQSPEFYAALWHELTGAGHWSGEIWNRRKDGEVYPELITISAVRDAVGKTLNYVALFSDITALKEHQSKLERIAHYDALTGMPNRVLLADRLKQAIAQTRRRGKLMALVYLDLDGFKAVNDSYGHETGDQLLIAVAQRLKEVLREGDTLARLGGDEFAAVLTDLGTSEECELILTRLLQAAAAPVQVRERTLQVSASIGVTLYPLDDGDADLLLRHADQAMYLAKQSGKNRYHLFDVDQDVAVKTQRESLEHVRRALDRRQFVLHYQPKVNMRTGAVIGAEALIRWQHPERGLLPPAAFLPIVEDHPISVELGEWVIDAALTQITAWHATGLDLPVSVNIGARQLQQDDFVPRLATLLAAHPDVKPAQLELEILETSALEDMAQVSEVMYACLALGVSFALDDFGTGYSSLTYLKRLPVDLLKIDQSFVRDMLHDTDDLAIIEGVIGLAAAFRRQVIAEGVETVAHGEQLLRLGCELGQGYGIARPMPAAELPGWIAGWHPDATWIA